MAARKWTPEQKQKQAELIQLWSPWTESIGPQSVEGTKGMRFPIDVILVCIRWYAANPLSYRHPEEMMQERACLSTILLSTAGRSGFCPPLKKSFVNTSGQLVSVGE